MKTIYILTYEKVFDFEHNNFNIGGLETYIQDLSRLITKHGVNCIVLIPNRANRVSNCDGIIVHGILLKKKPFQNIYQNLNNYAATLIKEGDIIILSSDQFGIRNKAKNVIAIQHGIAFDYPASFMKSRLLGFKNIALLFKTLTCIYNVWRLDAVRQTVCVDYNYFNWYRTLGTIYADKEVIVIPNYASELIGTNLIEDKLQNRGSKIKILFARRFVDYRGCLVFINCAKRLFEKYHHIEITFAGDGPLKATIREAFADNPNVCITSFNPSESVNFHFQYDMAIVPTIFSEGTSLTLCESMAAGCFPIATHVGGMTNMILDGFNGLLCYPSEEKIYETIVKALELETKSFNSIVLNARATVEQAFSIDIWKKKWSEVLKIQDIS